MATDAERERVITKWQMLVDRGGEHYARCDYCGAFKPTQMHELIYRSSTFRHSEARNLTYQKELCSLLCDKCHHKIHHGGGADENVLWRRNYALYGYEIVVEALAAVERLMKAPLGIILPEEND